ncbi:MAG: hypothetical protein ACUZ8E_04430, partial [Candidatus Anammoxibacter sp.]
MNIRKIRNANKYFFRKGDILNIDGVYHIMGLMPNDRFLPSTEQGETHDENGDEILKVENEDHILITAPFVVEYK